MSAGHSGTPRSEAPFPFTPDVHRFDRPDFGLSRDELVQALGGRDKARELARADAHERRRRAALAALDRIDRLPDIHAAAAWRLASSYAPGLPDRSALQCSITGCSHHGDTRPLQYAEAVQRVVAEIRPPEEEATPHGMWLVRGDEDEIAQAAQDRAASILAAIAVSHGDEFPLVDLTQWEPWEVAQQTDPAWWRRQYRTQARRAQAWIDCSLRMPRPGCPAVSRYTLGAWRQHMLRSAAWAQGQAVQFADGNVVPLPQIQSNAKKSRKAQLYAVSKAMEYYGGQNDFVAFFLTITLPGEYHPFTSGQRAADGSYPEARPNTDWNPQLGPKAQGRELQRLWALLRSRLAKMPALRQYFGITVPEPHKDGTPHLHAMTWLPRTFEHGGRVRQTAHVLRCALQELAPGRQARMEIVRKREDKTMPDGSIRRSASPASYVMKYILKGDASAEDGGEAWERHRAWLSSRGMRAMRLVGVHGSLRIWQRLWTAGDDEQMPARAYAAKDAMNRSAAAGERATTAAPDSPERAEARQEQAAAAAEALQLIGGLPVGDGRLALEYEEAETVHGKPTRRPVGIVDPVTLERMSLRRQKAAIVNLSEVHREQAEAARMLERAGVQDPVTVVAIHPRKAVETASPDLPDPVVAGLEAVIQTRQSLPQWQEWLPGAQARLSRLRGLPRSHAGPLRRSSLLGQIQHSEAA